MQFTSTCMYLLADALLKNLFSELFGCFIYFNNLIFFSSSSKSNRTVLGDASNRQPHTVTRRPSKRYQRRSSVPNKEFGKTNSEGYQNFLVENKIIKKISNISRKTAFLLVNK